MDLTIDDKTRLNFDKMMKEGGAEDNTTKIRTLKHSDKIREQVTYMMDILNKYTRLDKDMLNKMIETKCIWLYQNYSNLFLKLKKKQLNLQILDSFLSTLSLIEDGKLDQHEGSVKVGQLLKELYIDSAMKNQEQMEEKDNKKKKKKKFKPPTRKISWGEYKKSVN